MEVAPRDIPHSREELETVRSVFNAIQPQSIEQNREFCGYIIRTELGLLSATEPRRGRKASCSPRWPRGDVDVIASYHTHAAYDPEYDSEVPSYEDMESDILAEIDGYIATPAGRIWFINARRKEARLVCGPGCVVSDPNYQPAAYPPLRDRYRIRELLSD